MLLFSLFLVCSKIVFWHHLQFVLPISLLLFLFLINTLLLFVHTKGILIIFALCFILCPRYTMCIFPASLLFDCILLLCVIYFLSQLLVPYISNSSLLCDVYSLVSRFNKKNSRFYRFGYFLIRF